MPLLPGAAAALLAGVLHALSFAPSDAWWLQVLALAALAALVQGAPVQRAAALGWLFSVAWLAAGLWWLFVSMHRYGGLAAPLAALAVGVLAAALALYYALALAAFARWRTGQAGWDAAWFAACWTAAELARASWFTGFPWLAAGYAHTDGPLAGWAPWIGVYGIGALAVLLGASLAGAATRRPRSLRALAAAAALALAGLLLPQSFTEATGRLHVSLVQPAVAQDLKFDAERLAHNLEALAQAVRVARGTLVVTPESVVALPFSMVDPAYWRDLEHALARDGRSALVGVFLGDGQVGYVNSMIGLAPDSAATQGRFYRYGKQHLLPFGEFIPPGFRWFVRAMNIPLDDQARGQSSAAFEVGGQRVRPLICYEDLFGEDFAAASVGPGAPTLFANASNLAWFGTVMVLDQHLQISRMRALEFQRPFVRATNTGATAIVDHRGRVTHHLPPARSGTLDGDVEGRLGDTPYARWLAAWGLWPLVASVALAAGQVLLRRRRTPPVGDASVPG
jgi:apolipoprotein N-acyltransferase